MFDHYLITRFNLKNLKWDLTKNNETLLNDEWMENRMDLFENFCFPSVIAQSNKNFSWLLYFDSDTKEHFKKRILTLTENYQNIMVFFIDGMDVFVFSVKEFIRSQAKKEYLITSRIDNDDCIHIDFINEIQKQFQSQEYMAIDIISGYTLQIEPSCILGKKEHIFNPFISLIEKNIAPTTIWSNDHNLWKKEKNVLQVKNQRLWMSIIHGKNKVNEFNGYGNVDWLTIKEYFIIAESISNSIPAQLLPYKKWWFSSLKNRVNIASQIKSKMLKKKLGIYKLKYFFNAIIDKN